MLDNDTLVRLTIRLPRPTIDKLRLVAAAHAVPMSALVRMLMIEWAATSTRIDPPKPE